jgi:hypothetical protein
MISAGYATKSGFDLTHNCAADGIQKAASLSGYYQSIDARFFHLRRNVPPVGQFYCNKICEI